MTNRTSRSNGLTSCWPPKVVMKNRSAPPLGEDGSFTFLGLSPGGYSIRVEADGFIGSKGRLVQLAVGEDLHLPSPILLGIEGHAGCWYDPVAPPYEVKRGASREVEVLGQIIPPAKEHTTVSASVMAADSDVSRSTPTDSKGRFHLVLPAAGIVQLRILRLGRTELRSMLVPTEPGDRVVFSPIRVPKPKRGPWPVICY